MGLSDAEGRRLLLIARGAVAARLDHPLPDGTADTGDSDTLRRRAGAFVTIHLAGVLRGCIGHVEADAPVADTVRRVAVAAAREDPRFPALTRVELADVVFEVSVLGPLTELADATAIDVGRHGLVVDDGAHRGLLLPQVAVEWGWDAQTFLDQTCRKAGLPEDAWTRGARVWTFEAQVFSEERVL